MLKFLSLLFLACCLTPAVTSAQGSNPPAREPQQRAEQTADRFIERFRRTLDYGAAWKAFRLSDPSCAYKASGSLSQSDYERLNLSSGTVEKVYIALIGYYYLQAAYELSLVRIPDPEEPPTPKEITAIVKRSKFFQNEDPKLRTARDVNEMIAEFNHLARLYRKYMPKGALKSRAWQDNQRYLIARSGTDHPRSQNGDATLCIPAQNKVYIVDRGLFYFYMVEEHGTMRVAGLGID